MFWRMIIKIGVHIVSIWVAAQLIPGVTLVGEGWLAIVLVGVVFGIVNALLKPVLTILGLPFIVVTFGLFLLVINAALLGLTAALTDALVVSGVGAAVLGSLVISLVSGFLEWVFPAGDGD